MSLFPAAVTPFSDSGEIDFVSLARLLAFFEAAGCEGVVVGGTNGEGPSLSAVERRDLCREATAFAGKLKVIQGIATSALPEAIWLAQQAGKAGAEMVLVMPPNYFRDVPADAILNWYLALLDRSPIPVLAYHFPKMTGTTCVLEIAAELAKHDNFGGIKDSSGAVENLPAFRQACKSTQRLYVGSERLIPQAIASGWTGSISGVANVLPQWIAQLIRELRDPSRSESAATKFQLLLPLLDQIKSAPQPATHKDLLTRWRILERNHVRLPLTSSDASAIENAVRGTLGIHGGDLGLVQN